MSREGRILRLVLNRLEVEGFVFGAVRGGGLHAVRRGEGLDSVEILLILLLEIEGWGRSVDLLQLLLLLGLQLEAGITVGRRVAHSDVGGAHGKVRAHLVG